MKHLFSTAVATLALGACGSLFGKGPHVPSAYQGTTAITVANAWDHPLCSFAIFQDDAGDNWLGDTGKRQDIAPGARRTFNIKPGTYHVIGGFCRDGQAIAASGTYGAATVSVQGPSLIALGPNTAEPVAGAEMLAFPKLYTTGGNDAAGGGAEEEAPAETSEAASSAAPAQAACKGPGEETGHFSECCSGRATMRGTLHNGGTRVCCTNDQDCQSTP